MRAYPSHWIQTEIGKVGEIVTGKTPPTTNSDYYNGEIPFVKPPDLESEPPLLTTRDSVTAAGAATGRLLPEGAVAVSCIGNLGKVAVLGRPAVTNQQINAIIPTEGLESKFVYFWAKTLKPWLEQNASATTVAIINKGRFSTAPIGVPPLNEQRRIVAKIEDLTARSQAAKQALDAIPPLLERFRQSVLAAAFRGDLTKQWRQQNPNVEPATELLKRIRQERRHRWEQDYLAQQKAKGKTPKDDKWKEKYQESEPVDTTDLPQLPEGWCWASVEELASDKPRSIQSGPFGSNLKHSEFQSEGILAIGIDNVLEGTFSMGRANRVSEQKYQELVKYTARPLDVLITVMATVGRCCVVPENLETAFITKHVYRLSAEQRLINPRLLMFALIGAPTVLAQLKDQIQGATRAGINGTILKGFAIPVPPLQEQGCIVELLQQTIERERFLGEILSRESQRCDLLDQSILAKAFRGELVPQDPNDEPASALLERIRAEREAPDCPGENGGKRKGRGK